MKGLHNNIDPSTLLHRCLPTIRFSVAAGLAWGIIMLLTGLIASQLNWSGAFIHGVSEAYLGYHPTIIGSIIGFLWGFTEIFFGAFICSTVYNTLLLSSKHSANSAYTDTASLSPLHLGIAIGMTWLAILATTALISLYTGWGEGFIQVMGSRYLGYSNDGLGAAVGGIWGFADGLLFGLLIGAFYNIKCPTKASKLYFHSFYFGLALGVTWAVLIIITSIGNITLSWSGAFIEIMSSRYLGYQATLPGTLYGGLWAFIEAFITGLLLTTVYNYSKL